MTTLHERNNGSHQLEITQNDLDRVGERLERAGVPQELKEIALGIIRWHTEQGDDLDPVASAEDILRKDRETILDRLAEALQFDPRFTGLDGKWFIADKLPRIGKDVLQNVHRFLLQNPSASEHEILSLVKGNGSTNATLWRMALQVAFQGSPERFQNIGTAAHPQWKARLPEVEQAAVTHYAYDPRTFEVLCRPGQQLSQRKAERLRELDLYVHVVTFTE